MRSQMYSVTLRSWVMKMVGQVALALERHQQLQHLRPDRHVESAHRLVADDQLGLDAERPGNADALALAAGEFMGIAIHVFTPHVHRFEQVADDLAAFLARFHPELAQRVFERAEDRESRIERGMRVLEDDLQALAVGVELALAERGEVVAARRAVVDDLAVGGADELQDRLAQRGLAAAAFADKAEDLAAVDVDVHAIDGLHVADDAADHAGPDREVRLDPPQPEDDVFTRGKHWRVPRNASTSPGAVGVTMVSAGIWSQTAMR